MKSNNNITGIYALVSPDNVAYFGQSRHIRRRLGDYKRIVGYMPRKLLESLLRYGWESFSFSVAHQLPQDVSQDVLDEYEKFYISQYKEAGVELFNLQSGGRSSSRHSEETLIKMSQSQKGREKPYMVELNKNRVWNEAARGKIGDANKQRNWQVSSILKMSKPILQYTMSGEFIKEWISIHQAARETNIDRKSINSSIKDHWRHAGGYKWRHKS